MTAFARAQPHPVFYKVLDIARRIAGTGSLGVDRYAILVEGKGSPDGNYLLDLKEALPSTLAAHVPCAQPPWPTEAYRVVTIQRRLQAVSPAFLQPVSMGDKPRSPRCNPPRIAHAQRLGENRRMLEPTLLTMAKLLAWAQLRSSAGKVGISPTSSSTRRRTKWRNKLIDASSDCAAQVLRDAEVFNAAYDAMANLAR
jgi:uncharacterized protein (DUF2252 family)